MHGCLGCLCLVDIHSKRSLIAVVCLDAHILLPLASIAVSIPVGGVREISHVVVAVRQCTDGKAIVGGVLKVGDNQVEYLRTYDSVKQQVAGTLDACPSLGTVAHLWLQCHLYLVASTTKFLLHAIPIEVDGVAMRIGTVETAVVWIVSSFSSCVVSDEHGHKLSVEVCCYRVVIVTA